MTSYCRECGQTECSHAPDSHALVAIFEEEPGRLVTEASTLGFPVPMHLWPPTVTVRLDVDRRVVFGPTFKVEPDQARLYYHEDGRVLVVLND